MSTIPPVDHPIKIPVVLSGLGGDRIDNYYWLNDIENPETIKYIGAENRYAREVLEQLEPLRAKIYEEFLSRIELADSSVPQRKTTYWYYSKTSQDSQYEIHLRFLEGQEHQVILDENELAKDLEYFALGSTALSEDENLLAYGVDTDGSEEFKIYLIDLTTKATLEIPVSGATYGLEFDRDGTRLFWIESDETTRPYRVWSYDLTTASTHSDLIFYESDESFAVSIAKSKDNRFLMVETNSTTSSEAHLLDLDDPHGALQVFVPRTPGLEYSIEPTSDQVYILSNHNAENFKISVSPRVNASFDSATDLVEYDPSVKIESIEIFSGYVAIEERRDGFERIRLVNLATDEQYLIPVDEVGSTLELDSNPHFDTGVLRYSYTSMLCPRSIREIKLDTHEVTVLKNAIVKGSFSPDNYQSQVVTIDARDGTQIPVSILSRRNTELNQQNPVLLYGYGSYELSMDPGFSSLRLSLCDRGFVFAIAHVRGGGELGRKWYLDGKLELKHNTFNDFVDAALGLCHLGWTHPGMIVSWGGSAGGMLVGAALNQRPDLFAGVIAEVPFVDCLTTISDPTIPLTIAEWQEWGNPLDNWEIYQEMASYTPYDNIVPDIQYPPIFATSGLNDPRVSYFEPTKWIAKIREITTNPQVMLWTESEGGHFGSSGRFNEWEVVSRLFAFAIACVFDQESL